MSTFGRDGGSTDDRRKSPQGLKKFANHSDSDASGESLSLSQESNTEVPLPSSNATSGLKRLNRRSSEWEILEGLRDGQRYESRPEPFTGYLNKKRKWPLKGWHKRYFVLDTGILKYGKSPNAVSQGKIHGSVDIGLSVISTKSKRKRIDIDAEEFIYHLKAKQYEVFAEWADQLKKHRLHRQHLLTFGVGDNVSLLSKEVVHPAKLPLTRKLASDGGTSPPLRLQWLIDSGPLQVAVTELNHTQQALVQLGKILEQLEQSAADNDTVNDGFSPNVKKDRRKFGLRKKKSGKGSFGDLSSALREDNGLQVTSSSTSPSPSRPCSLVTDHAGHHAPISSSASLSAPITGSLSSGCLPSSSIDVNLASDFYILAKDIYSSLKSVVYTVNKERDRLSSSPDEKLKTSLNAALRQNIELRGRLASITRTADISDVPEPITSEITESDFTKKTFAKKTRILHSSLSRSSCASEFFDAEEGEALEEGGATSDASSIAGSSEDGSVSSEPSDLADSEYNPTIELPDNNTEAGFLTGRRNKLPATRPNMEGLSLWNLLTRNIGKDLSQVSMPVALNEPLSMLQRLCEELEYSDLLDKAATLTDPVERMVHVAAFAVSSYSSSYFRAGSKPFNPLLGETYEAIREDRGFRFVAEQVSHHPPISVCHASSRNFTFVQDVRIKTKFWGKSMEFQPSGFSHLKLERPDGGKDAYRWNKVTTCVHSLFSENRWLEQYGELIIHNDSYTCTINFLRSSYWSPKRCELQGSVVENKTKQVVRKLFGKWNEGLYSGVAPSARCIWRPGTLPPDAELYYGFTRFAIELNELQPDMVNFLPPTDTRFRPDQRLLEEGKLEEAEKIKMQLEQAQRERRKKNETEGHPHDARWFRKNIGPGGIEVWDFTNEYWEARKKPGFAT
uniref:Oxysterol-binding protein-related protein 6 n=2 Tax=Lygus hesperus TaxID=30085 RepID=A0A0A9W540_LYGHE